MKCPNSAPPVKTVWKGIVHINVICVYSTLFFNLNFYVQL